MPVTGPARVETFRFATWGLNLSAMTFWTLLTWSHQGLSADAGDAAAHVYGSGFCDRRAIALPARFK